MNSSWFKDTLEKQECVTFDTCTNMLTKYTTFPGSSFLQFKQLIFILALKETTDSDTK